jgi:hypothetical protein
MAAYKPRNSWAKSCCPVCGREIGAVLKCHCAQFMWLDLEVYAYNKMRSTLDKWHVIAMRARQEASNASQ